MFKYNKKLRKIEQEKQKLVRLKEILEDTSPKIDIKNLYIFSIDDINYIVRLEVKQITGKNLLHGTIDGFETKVIDIFSGKTIYVKSSSNLIERKEYINDKVKNIFHYKEDYAYLKPILEVNKDLLAYPNMLVPEYVIINLYHQLNDINIDSSILRRKKDK